MTRPTVKLPVEPSAVARFTGEARFGGYEAMTVYVVMHHAVAEDDEVRVLVIEAGDHVVLIDDPDPYGSLPIVAERRKREEVPV